MSKLSFRRTLGVACLLACAGLQAQPAPPPLGASLPGGGADDLVIPPSAPPPDVSPPGLEGPPAAPLASDAPKPSSDVRNLEGTWRHDQGIILRMSRDMYGKPLPYTAKAKRIVERRLQATYDAGVPYSNASGECIPPGQPWLLEIPGAFQIYQTPQEIAFAFEEYHGRWNIRLNQSHRVTERREYQGDSVGHWDGDTLVVETINYKRSLWLDVDGTPASKNARMVHRIRRMDDGRPRLEIVTTIDDAEMFSAPWSFVRTFGWQPESKIFNEYNCEFQVGLESGVARYGLIAEPIEE